MIDRVALLSDLKKLLKLLQDDLRARCDQQPDLDVPVKAEWQSTRDAGRTAAAYTVWREEWITQVGAAWLLATVFVRFMEDNELVGWPRLAGPGDRRRIAQDNRTQYFNEFPTHSDRDYLLHVVEAVAALPTADRLFDRRHNPLWRLGPSGDFATRIVDFWQCIDPASGELVHDFTDQTLNTRFLGDLYQDLSEEAQKKYALLQTPEFVEEFILDRTLMPAIETFGYREVRLIDPACGSGHFLLGAFRRLFGIARRHEPAQNPWELARRALLAVHGVDVNPFAVAIARFRLLVEALQACQITRLADAPDFPLEVYTGDSLLLGRRLSDTRAVSIPLDPDDSVRRTLATEDRQALDRVLGQQYHVVVGNPPYITPKDSKLNSAYRERYGSCYGKYQLAVPFIERFFDLALSSEPPGFVGVISANSFMQAVFGKKLVENYIPKWDLTHIIDCKDAYIPGHTTSTVILVGRNHQPLNPTIRAVLGFRGAPIPADPARGEVWSEIVAHVDQPGAPGQFVTVSDVPRERFYSHPWSIGGGGASELKETLGKVGSRLTNFTSVIGVFGMTNADEAMIAPAATFHRHGVEQEFVRRLARGDEIRDWSIAEAESVIFPYRDEQLVPIESTTGLAMWLWPVRTVLGNRATFAKITYFAEGRPWWEWHQVSLDRLRAPHTIAFAFVATHNHFALDASGLVFNRTAPIIKLRLGSTEQEHLALLAILNSSTVCFWLKQVCRRKGLGGQGGGIKLEDWHRAYEIDASKIGPCPIPDQYMSLLALGSAATKVAKMIQRLAPVNVIAEARGQEVANALEHAKKESESAFRYLVALQEEIDWFVYGLFGLCEYKAATDDDLSAGLCPEARPVEILLRERLESGETSIFYDVHQYRGAGVCGPVGAGMEALIEKRVERIRTIPALGLIEGPNYKRRWQVEPWSSQQQRALRSWLLDRLETPDYWPKRELVTCAQLAARAKRDAEFMQVAEVYRGAPDFDVVKLVTELIADEAVPFLPVLRYAESGTRKREAWERTWELQRQEDVTDARTELPDGHPDQLSPEQALKAKKGEIGDIPVPPQYISSDFRASTFWRLRGKLDVSKERFITYPHASREVDPSPVVAWAGWGHLDLARALSAYYLLLKEQDGWSAARLTPLLSGLLELIPWLKQWHNDIDSETGERLGDYFDSFFEAQARALGLTRAAIRAWKP